MYAAYFGLIEAPFSIAPDPRYLYLSDRHREAMAHLLYGIRQAGGFVQLTGEVGTGKTTLCRCLLSQLPDDVDVALLLNPQLDGGQLLAAICDELTIDYPKDSSSRQLLDILNEHLLRRFAEGRHTVLIVDEAQLLPRQVLEQIRLLTNLETTKQKLLQIILFGQPELNRSLQRKDLRQLAQRITARYHLEPLSSRETREYIRYRLGVAGCQQPLFGEGALIQVHRHAGGIPRLINVICDRALLGAYSQDRSTVNAATVRQAAHEVLGGRTGTRWAVRWIWAPVLAVLAAALLVTVYDPIGGLRTEPTLTAAAPAEDQAAAVATPQTQLPPAPADQQAGAEDEAESPQLPGPTEPDVVNTEPGVTEPAPTAELERNETAREVVVVDDTRTPHRLTHVMAGADTASLSTMLRETAAVSGRVEAFSRLTELWGRRTRLRGDEQPCLEIARLGLQCLHQFGTWDQLRDFNRAAVIVLRGENGLVHYPVLIRLDKHRATLDFNGEQVAYPIAEIDRYWTGDYWLLWRPPPYRSQQLAYRDRGADVLWLRRALRRVPDATQGAQAVNVEKADFDSELLLHVVGFQRRHDLEADGIVGLNTLMRLNTVLDGDELPLLAGPPAG